MINLGPCCSCQKNPATVLLTLPKRAPIAGHGWGCVVCGLPEDGASAVLCSLCFEAGQEPLFACRGYPATEGRILIGELSAEPFEHDKDQHEDKGL